MNNRTSVRRSMPKAATTAGRASSTLLLALLAAACEPGPDGHAATVFYASGAELQSINPLVTVHPLAKQVQKHVLFLTLADYDERMEPRSRLATWTWSDDRRRLQFELRRDVRWHDGTPTTAADVVWTLDRARDPRVAYPRATELRDVTGAVARDSFSLTLQFRRPQPVFPDVLTDLAILPRHRLTAVPPERLREAPFNRAPVGNGPFVFVEHRANQRWVFDRSPGFPAALGQPHVDRFVVAIVDEPTTKLAALTSGELDFAGINPAHAAFVRRDARLQVIDYPILLSYAVVFNLRRVPFDDPTVRRALSRAIDRGTIIRAYLFGFGTVASGPVSPEHPWYNTADSIPFDPAAAAALLEAGGWRRGPDGVRVRNGARLAFDLLTVGTGDMALEQMLQAQWRGLGVAVRIRQLELTTFLATAQSSARDFDALVTGIPGDFALGHVAAMFDGDGPLAYPGLRDAAVAAAFGAVRAAGTATELEAAWRGVQRALAAVEAVAWVYHARGVQGAARRVAGVRIDLRGELAGIAAWRLATTPADGRGGTEGGWP